MKSALESFALVEHTDKFVILGDMFELGVESFKEHEKIAELITKLSLNAICIGKHFCAVLTNPNTKIKSFETKEEASIYIQDLNLANKLILLKGSRGIGLESIVPFL
jgi:UDP-N-acetylmuramoyl-tripeptide--D-alanyl-D-alanine ligase